jgi:5-methylcytosine-specific restriction endonuclease McrA
MTVLVLNQNYEPLSVAGVRRALALLGTGRAEVLEHGVPPIRTPSRELARPSVIRLVAYVRRPRPRVRFSRREIFRRDGYTCQYCGRTGGHLTLDHVFPRHRGGRDGWENLVTACRSCNQRKGGRTPQEARMTLRRRPFEPKATVSALLHPDAPHCSAWRLYLGEPSGREAGSPPEGWGGSPSGPLHHEAARSGPGGALLEHVPPAPA